MAHPPLSGRPIAAALAWLALFTTACAARQLGPVPSTVTSLSGPNQQTTFRTGHARARITSPVHRTFRFGLQPSAIYSSPPARLELGYGEPASGEGLGLELPPARGSTLTSPRGAILTLAVRLPGSGLIQATSMEGECKVALFVVGNERVAGRFACHGLRQDVGVGPSVSVAGTFEATR